MKIAKNDNMLMIGISCWLQSPASLTLPSGLDQKQHENNNDILQLCIPQLKQVLSLTDSLLPNKFEPSLSTAVI